MILFQETWAECEALRAKEKIEASGQRANWEECLRAAQTQARELFQPIFSGLERNAALPPFSKKSKNALKRPEANPLNWC